MERPTVVYGATGFTGRLVAAELIRRGVPIVVAGRSAPKLTTLAARLGPLVQDTAVAALDDPDALRRAAAAGPVLVNCAGPFVGTGAPVLDGCVAAGTHYLDTTGEQEWIRHVFDDHAPALDAAGVAAVPGMGLDFMPGDLLAHLVGAAVEPCRRLTVAYHLEGFGMTRGTQRSLLGAMDGRDVGYADGRWARGAGARPWNEHFDFPPPIGRQVVARYPAGEVVTVPRHVRTQEMVLRLSGASVTPAVPPALPLAAPAVARLLRTPFRGLLDRLIDRLPEGPSESDRAAVRWTIVVEAAGEDGRLTRGEVSGPDVYGVTAHTIALGAAALADEGFSGRGALAPAHVLDPASALDALGDFGVRWSTSSITTARSRP